MNRKAFLVVLGALFLCSAAGVALAGLENSAHDIVSFNGLTGATAKQGACSFCHVPHKATGNKLFPNTIDVTGLGSGTWSTDTIGQICWSCHGNIQTVGNRVRNVMPFNAASHKRSVATLVAWTDTADLNNVYGVVSSNIGCVSCHNVHDNDKRPFIRDRAGYTYTEGDFQTFCTQCHVNRVGTVTHQNHPTGLALATANADVNIKTYATLSGEFKNTYPSLAVTKSATDGTDSWNLGGKMKYVASGDPTDFNCGTCHAVHHNETANYSAADGYQLNGVSTAIDTTGHDQLAVLSIVPTSGVVAPICSGCHNITANAGPGAIGTFSHPWNTIQPWGTSINSGAAVAAGAKFGGILGTDASLDCQSCHDMHWSALARTAVGTGTVSEQNYALMRVNCNTCHDSTSAKSNHHPTGSVTLSGNGTLAVATIDPDAANSVYVATAIDWTKITWDTTGKDAVSGDNKGLTGFRTSSNAKVYNFGTVAAGVGTMTCGTCHTGGANTAHNNAGSFPAYTGDVANDGMCIDCHGLNPSNNAKNAADKATRLGTHFVGPIQTVNYKWAQGSGIAVTPQADSSIRYGTGPTNGAIVCTSCHTLKTKTAAGVARAVYRSSSNTGDGEDSTRDAAAVGLLLTPAGNAVADTATTNDFLCTACHGAAPGSGSTHPVQPTSTTVTSPATDNANLANNNVTTVSDAITCESCHRPHNGATDGKTLILEVATNPGTYINETVLCTTCHVK